CGPIVVGAPELAVLEHAAGRKVAEPLGEALAGRFRLKTTNSLQCSLLKDKRCSVYESRPLICRLWGMVKKMRCEWGCTPERWVADEEAFQLLTEVERG